MTLKLTPPQANTSIKEMYICCKNTPVVVGMGLTQVRRCSGSGSTNTSNPKEDSNRNDVTVNIYLLECLRHMILLNQIGKSGKWIKLALHPVRGEQQQIKHWLLIASDITQVKYLLQSNEKLTHFDVLTELPNRQYFWQQLEQSISKGHPFFLLYLDIKHFKKVNEIHGHLVGDKIIQHSIYTY